MATEHLHGTASLEFESEIHLLAVPLSPLRELVPSRRKRRFDWWAEDLITREVVTVGPGVEEATVTIRMDNQPDLLMRRLEAAMDEDQTVNYRTEESGGPIPLRIVEIVGSQRGEIFVVGDRGRFGGGEWEVAIVVRRTDGGSIAEMFGGDAGS